MENQSRGLGSLSVSLLKKLFPERPVQILFLGLLLVQFLLVAGHIGGIIWDTVAPSAVTAIVREFFGLSTEGNAPTWFASFLFTLIGLTCGAIYWVEGYQPQKTTMAGTTRFAWLIFAALFLFLSFDETSQFHERLDWIMSGAVDDAEVQSANIEESEGIYKYLLIYIPVLGTLGLAMAWFVLRRFQRPVTAFLFLAGMTGFALKLVIEIFEKWSLSTNWFGHSLYVEAVIVEMSCLFTGATLIVTSLLSYLLGLSGQVITVRTVPAGEPEHTANGRKPAFDSSLETSTS